jgi:hypothetical protein
LSVGLALYFEKERENSLGIILVVLAILLVLSYLLRALRISVYNDRLVAGFKVFRKKIMFEDISAIETTTLKFSDSIGMHTDLAGNWSIIARTGPGLIFKLKNNTAIKLSANNPDMLIGLIRPYLPNMG